MWKKSWHLLSKSNLLYFVGIDLVGPLWECNGYKYIVTAVCYFSKYVKAKPITEKTGEQIGLFIYQLFCRYGCMQVVISDNGEDSKSVTSNVCKFFYLEYPEFCILSEIKTI